ncbi:MAG: hypothetical protein Q8P32_05135 [Candidatus Komeilibacteria bacterium]|nr:hypothetical protein [Candidatus Komeilibacteria bacterium]
MSDIKRTMPMGGMNMGDQGMEQGQPQYMAQPPMMPKKSGMTSKIVAVIVVIVVILIGLFLVSKYTSWNILNVNKEAAGATGWQAVFLTNGQVYFGKVAKENNDTIVLEDIYYLQVAQSPQPTPEGQQSEQNLSLVKLGNELHGPKDAMKINMAQVLFTEELKADSKVVDAIVRYKEDQAL